MKKEALTKSELEIMTLLWRVDKPLTASEIIEHSTDKTWKDSYVHLLINSLMEKGIIEVAGFKKATKNYARTFKPTVSREEYLVLKLTKSKNYSKEQMPVFFKALISKTNDTALLNELEEAIKARKAEL